MNPLRAGLSGDRLKVLPGNKILKISPAENLKNVRLQQIYAEGRKSLDPIQAVPILDCRESRGRLLIVMPYLKTATVAYMATPDQHEIIARAIYDSLKARLSKATMEPGRLREPIQARIREVDRPLLGRFDKIVSRFPDWILEGDSHGDFGFANLLLEDKTLYAIDFHQHPINTPLMDFVRLSRSVHNPCQINYEFMTRTVDMVWPLVSEHRLLLKVLNIYDLIQWLPTARDEHWVKLLTKLIQKELGDLEGEL